MPRKISLTHGGGSKLLLRAALDGRTVLGKAHRAQVAALTAQVGGDPSPAMASLIDRASRLALLGAVAWGELIGGGAFRPDGVAPSVDVFLRTIRQEAAVLQMIGLNRTSRDITLADVLEGRADAS